jgi:flagellar M-ring protein FliF
MDFLNKSLAQLSDLFRSMTPGARITAGLLLAVVVVSFGYLFQHASAGPDAFLFGGEALSDDEINAVEGAIAAARLSGFVREGNRIRVPAAQKAEYLAAVVDGGAMPRNANTILANALDNGKWYESREATSQRLKIATQQTLGEIVRAMRWVEAAFVLCGEQQSGGGNRLGKSAQQTASVTVRPVSGESLDPRREKMLKQFVAHAVGMSVENVAVINLGDGSGDIGDGDMFPEWFDDPYYKTKVAFEMQKRRSIMNVLRDIPGVRVEVTAELDNMMVEESRGTKPDKNAVDRSETTSREESTKTVASPSGNPGVTSQGPNRQIAANVQSTTPDKNITTSETYERVVGMDETFLRKHGLTPKSVWATVTIPARYIEDVWKLRI